MTKIDANKLLECGRLKGKPIHTYDYDYLFNLLHKGNIKPVNRVAIELELARRGGKEAVQKVVKRNRSLSKKARKRTSN